MSDKPHPLVEKLRARLGDRVTGELADVVADLVVLDPSSAHQLLLDVLVDLQTLAGTAAPSKCIASGKLFPSGMLWLAAEQGAPREYWCPQCHAQWPQLHEDITTREGCAVVPEHKPVPMTEAYAHRQLEMRAQWYRARGAAVPLFLLKKGVEAQGAIRLERRLCRCTSCNLEVPLTINGRAGLHFIDKTDAESGLTTHEGCPGSLCFPRRPEAGQ